MRQYLVTIITSFFFIALVIILPSCNDEMKDHYKNEAEKAVSVSLINYIQTDTSLRTFYQLLVKTGYDEILNTLNTFTVWAPDNNALKGVDTSNIQVVNDLLANHIARFLFSASGGTEDTVTMLNGKIHYFVHSGSNVRFDNVQLNGPGVLTSNGIVYSMNGYAPFYPNIYEYIQRTPGLETLNAFIKAQIRKEFLIELSDVIGQDAKGNKIYDSVFSEPVNVLFNYIGNLDREDSTYTVILPDNQAWNEAYGRIQKYFVSNDPIDSANIRRYYTQYYIVWDMVFRGRVTDPNSVSLLKSTVGHKFYQPGYLFNNIIATPVSNGLVYKTNQLFVKDTSSWLREIRVEAEDASYRTSGNCNVYSRNSYGSSFQVSQKEYILATNTTTSSNAYVQFSIPNTLAAKYNIYVVFIPPAITDTTDVKPCKVSFKLFTTSRKNPPTTSTLSVSSKVTNAKAVDKVLVWTANAFPFCDLNYNTYTDPHIKIRVTNDALSKADLQTYNASMRIDCIILEPIAQ